METKDEISILSLAWPKVKKYWRYVVAFFVAVLGLIILKRPHRSRQILENARKSYKEELKVMKEAAAKEEEDKAAAKRRYDEAIQRVESEFDTKMSKISAKKKEMIKELITDTEKDSDEISRELASILGVKFVDKK